MDKQHIDQQIEYVRHELTRISQELVYLDGTQLQMLRVRQSRLVAELERLQALQVSGSFGALLNSHKLPFRNSITA
jgi:hypothetical protein